MGMKFTSTTYIASSDNEGDFVTFCQCMDFLYETFDVFVVKSLTAITERLTREFEEETHRKNNKE